MLIHIRPNLSVEVSGDISRPWSLKVVPYGFPILEIDYSKILIRVFFILTKKVLRSIILLGGIFLGNLLVQIYTDLIRPWNKSSSMNLIVFLV